MHGRVPEGPVAVEAVIAAFPTLRQSILAKHDDCPLSSLMEMRFATGWNTHPQARGTIFHLFAAKVMQTLREEKSRTIPVQLAEQILIEACRQETNSRREPIPARDIVRVPIRQMPELRMAARKFAKDNAFSYEKIIDVERRLGAELTYPRAGGGLVTRTLTGQLDALLYAPPDGAIVLDWKDTWALPPEPKERDPDDFIGEDDELRGISYHGYFQQRFYGWLVMKNYSNVNSVTLREFYARKTKARKATLTRDRMAEVEEELSVLAQAFDLALMEGAPPYPFGWWPAADPATGEIISTAPKVFDIDRLGRWRPQPGKHCGFCARSRDCPIDEDTRIEQGAPPATEERARGIAAELQVVNRVRDVLIKAAKAWVEEGGAPIPVRHGKGRSVLGWYETKRGRRFGLYTPDDSDRGGHADLDRQLAEAMREATTRARDERPKRERRRRPGKL